MLTIEQAKQELQEAVRRNPGLWEQHSLSVAENARRIAAHAPGMDADRAYVMGLMHDIGRRAGVTGIRHIFDGYDYMVSIGQSDIARVCLTHSYPLKDAEAFQGIFDGTPEQMDFLRAFLAEAEYDDYDILIQLCDAISLPNGACIMEKRLIDVALRHGLPPYMPDKWRAFMNTKKHFDRLCGANIYTLLPNVMENSYGDLI